MITHRIVADVCMARQGTQFHKCHKCVFRGKAADWQPEATKEIVVELEPQVAAADNGKPRRQLTKPARKQVRPGKEAEAEV